MRIKLKYLLYRDVFYYKNLFYGAKLLGILDYDVFGRGCVCVLVFVMYVILFILLDCVRNYVLFVCGGGELSV